MNTPTLQDFPITYAAFYLAVLGAYAGVYEAVKKNVFSRPLLVAFGTSIALTMLVGLAGYSAGLSVYIAWGLPVMTGIIFVFIVWSTSKGRDIGGISIAETLSSDLANIDKQLSFILNGIVENKKQELLLHAINAAFSYSLGSLYKLLKLGIKDDSHISIYHAQRGRFTVIASERVSASHADQIFREFRYGNESRGLAGHAASRRAIIYIPDLEDQSDENIKFWLPLDNSEKKIGSIICIPLTRGLWETGNNDVIGILNLTSLQKKAFGTPYKLQLITLFGNKVEILLYLLEMVQGNDN